MSDSRVEETKRAILQDIEALVSVAERQRNKVARKGLIAQATTLTNLGERIELHHLPDVIARSVISDIRLDALMILSDLKVSLTFRKQEVAAPTEKLRAEAHERRVLLDDSEVPTGDGGGLHGQLFAQIVSDLSVLADVENSLRKCTL